MGYSKCNGEICSYVLFSAQKGIENKLRNELKSERVRLEAVIECSQGCQSSLFGRETPCF